MNLSPNHLPPGLLLPPLLASLCLPFRHPPPRESLSRTQRETECFPVSGHSEDKHFSGIRPGGGGKRKKERKKKKGRARTSSRDQNKDGFWFKKKKKKAGCAERKSKQTAEQSKKKKKGREDHGMEGDASQAMREGERGRKE